MNRLKFILLLSLFVLACFSSGAFAWRGGGGHGSGGYYHSGGGFHSHYWGGYHGWGWFGYPAVVGYPYGYPYYYGVPYPVYTEVAVAAPMQSSTEPSAQIISPSPVFQKESIGDAVTIFIPDSKGNNIPVKLIKQKGGYSGPQGEFYPNNPTIAQLRALYVK